MWALPLALLLLLHSYFLIQNSPIHPASNESKSSAPTAGAAAGPDMVLALHSAVRTGDLEQVIRLLEAGADPNSLDPLGGTPLLTACWLGHTSIASALLSRGADVDAVHREAGATALEYAVLKGRPDVVHLLLAAGADTARRYRGGQTVLDLAAARPPVAIVDELISAKADLAATDDLGNAPLDEAVLHNQADAVRSLLDHGAPLEYRHAGDGRDALDEACVKGYPGIVE